MSEIEYSDKPEWQSQTALLDLLAMTLCAGGRLVMDNWDAKYINARIDMRTGHVLLREGNILEREHRKPRYIVVRSKNMVSQG